MVGDGELCEGSNWEAIMAAGHFKLGNLVAIVDKNKLSMTTFTHEEKGMNVDPLDKKFKAFGWDVMEFDGNDMSQVCQVLEKLPASTLDKRKPIFLISNTIKGKGVSFMENNWKWHGGAIAKEQLDEALRDIKKNRSVR